MSAEQTSPQPERSGGLPATAPSEQVALQYVDDQLQKARGALRRTRIISILVVLVVLGYFGFLASYVRTQYLEPKAAAEMANAYAVAFVQENGPELSGKLKQEIPRLIQRLPDYALEQLPRFREDLENTLEERFTQYCQGSAVELGEHLDSFLEENREAINDFLEAGQTPEGAKELAANLEEEIRLYLQDPGADGESVSDKLNAALHALKQIEARLHRLANGADLTPQETQLRRAIAVMMTTVERDVPKLVD
jgi:hypothetical protein